MKFSHKLLLSMLIGAIPGFDHRGDGYSGRF